MTSQTSRLEIIVDARRGKKQIDDFNKGLKEIDKTGENVSKKSEKVGSSLKSVGDNAKNAKGKVSDFGKSLDDVSTKAEGASLNLNKFSGLTRGAALGVAAIAGTALGAVGGLTALAIQFANNAAEIERFAYLANSSTTEFQRWAVGALQMGVSGEQLADVLKDVNEKVGEFVTTGGGEGKDAFEQLIKQQKLTIEESKKLALAMQKTSGPEALQLYVNALEKAGVSHEQMSFYVENMGNDLTKLLPLLYNNGEGMKGWADAAERAGAIMDEQTIKKAKELQVQTQLLQLQLTGMKNQIMQAVVPALVNIADAFFSSTEQGVQLSDMADGLAKTLKVLASVAVGVATAFNAVGKAIGGSMSMMSVIYDNIDGAEKSLPLPLMLAKGAYDARDQLKTIASETVNDVVGSVKNGAKQIDKIWNNTTSEQVGKLTNLLSSKAPKIGLAGGLNDFEESMTKDAKKAADKSRKLQEQIERDRQQIRKSYASFEQRAFIEYQEERQRIALAFASSPQEMELYLQRAEKQYSEELKLAKMYYEFDLIEHKLSAENKLRYSFNIKEQEIKANTKLDDKQKADSFEMLRTRFNQELGLLKLAQEQQLFQANQRYMSEIAIMQERYRLERLEIAKTHPNDPAMQAKLLQASRRAEKKEINDQIRDAAREMGQIKFDMQGGISQLDQENLTKFQRHDSNDKLFSARIAGVEFNQDSEMERIQAQLEQGLITQQQFEDQKTAIIQDALEQRKGLYSQFVVDQKEIDDAYNIAQIEFYMKQAQGTIGAFQGMFGAVLGEQSSAYRAMYEASRTFALAQAGMNLWKSASDAYAAAPGTVWQKLGESAKAIIDQGTFIAMIQAATPPAFATGGLFTKDGYVRGPGTTTSDSINARLSDKEFVTNAWAVRKIGLENMEYMNRTGEIPQNHADGGYVSNSTAVRREARQFDAINTNRQNEKTENIQISQSITFSDSGAKMDTQGQKDVAQSLNAAMDAWARKESMQGGVLYKIVRSSR